MSHRLMSQQPSYRPNLLVEKSWVKAIPNSSWRQLTQKFMSRCRKLFYTVIYTHRNHNLEIYKALLVAKCATKAFGCNRPELDSSYRKSSEVTWGRCSAVQGETSWIWPY